MRLNQVSVFPNREGVFLAKRIIVDTRLTLHGSGILPLINRRRADGLSSSFIREFSTSSSLKQQKSKLDSLLESFPSLSERAQQLYTTINIKECSQVLLRMYNSLTDPIVKQYIENNCLHLMFLGKYTKEITKGDFLDFRVDGLDKEGHPSLYTGKSGCYAFLCLKTGDYYVGSAVCLNTRYKAHKVNSSRPERGGSNSLYLSVRKHGRHNFI